MDSSQRQHHAIGSAAAFRTQHKQYALHPLEKTLAGLVIILLVFLPWALGGIKPWAQWIAFGLAASAFIVSLIPRNYDDRYHAGGNLRLFPYPRLLHFPIFWLGLVYFAIIICQILNPAWAYNSSSTGWWLEMIDYINWLPHGIERTPFAKMNGWRTLLIQSSAWLLFCALWVGVTRRKTARSIVTILALNGFLISLLIAAHRLTETANIYWLYKSPTERFAGSFLYKNHAGAYICLIIALTLGLAWWHTNRAQPIFRKSHPGTFFYLLAFLVLVGSYLSHARASTILSACFVLAATCIHFIRAFYCNRGRTPLLVTASTTLLAIGFMAFVLFIFKTESIIVRFERIIKEEKFSSITMRRIAAQATFTMANDSIFYGHGAGSFRYLFPRYQQQYPEIWSQEQVVGNVVIQRRLFWEYAHNDYAQLLAEVGLVGVTLASLTLLAILVAAWKNNLFSQLGLLLMLGGPAMVFATATVDFPLHNPAVLFTTVAVVALVLRWAEFSRRV